MINVKSNNTIKSLPEMNDLCNPNLLDNADFKSGIINQRGANEYSLGENNPGWQVTIDRWIGNCAYVQPNNGYLFVHDTSDTSKAYMLQGLDSVCNGDYVMYIKVSAVTKGQLNCYFDTEKDKQLSITEDGEYIHKFSDVSNQNKFTLELDDFEGNIERIKLEQGTVYTGMPIWNQQIEYLKCCKYYYRVNAKGVNVTLGFVPAGVETEMAVTIELPTTMAKTPTINYNGFYISQVSGYWGSVGRIDGIYMRGKYITFGAHANSSSSSNGKFRLNESGIVLIQAPNGFIEFNAETY